MRHRDRSAARSSISTRPRKPTLKYLEHLAPSPQVLRRYYLPRSLHRRKASLFPTKPGPVPLPCRGGSNSNQVKKSSKSRRKRVNRPTKSIAPKSSLPKKRSRKRAANVVGTFTPSTPARGNSETDTPLRIPYGNKDAALRLGARYRAGGWYAPAGVDLAAFGERGWLLSQAPASS